MKRKHKGRINDMMQCNTALKSIFIDQILLLYVLRPTLCFYVVGCGRFFLSFLFLIRSLFIHFNFSIFLYQFLLHFSSVLILCWSLYFKWQVRKNILHIYVYLKTTKKKRNDPSCYGNSFELKSGRHIHIHICTYARI